MASLVSLPCYASDLPSPSQGILRLMTPNVLLWDMEGDEFSGLGTIRWKNVGRCQLLEGKNMLFVWKRGSFISRWSKFVRDAAIFVASAEFT
ncbi:hypothetical protein BDW72DRAFT_30798 [Aspergillus terricola var. indicus]